MTVQDTDALYYPYIHIRDLDWLKRNLLLFPRICRIVPDGFAPSDMPEITAFVRARGSRGPFLDRANLTTGSVYYAVMTLAEKFRLAIAQDPQGMITRFGQAATEADPTRDPMGFQYHHAKAPELTEVLKAAQIAWKPRNREPWDSDEYVEVHPHVGEAIMTTLALACASDEGLQIVTDNQPLHRCLAENDIDGVFDTWINRTDTAPAPRDSTEHKLAIAVFERADLSKVTPERLQSLHHAWEPRLQFLEKIRELAATIPPMQNLAREQERIQDLADKTITTWQRERKRLGLTDIFPAVSGDSLKEIGKSLINRLAVPAISASTATIAAPHHGLLFTGAGLAIGVVGEGVKTAIQTRRAAAKSPFRYLTLTEKAGVSYSVGA